MQGFSALKGVLYKAWRLNMSFKIVTIIELLLPLFSVIIVFIGAAVSPPQKIADGDLVPRAKARDEFMENNSELYVAYTPSNKLTDDFIAKVRDLQVGDYVAMSSEEEMDRDLSDKIHSKNLTVKYSSKIGLVFNVKESVTSFPRNFVVKLRTSEAPGTEEIFEPYRAADRHMFESKYRNKFLAIQAAVSEVFLKTINVGPSEFNWTLQLFPQPLPESEIPRLKIGKLVFVWLLELFYLVSFLPLVSLAVSERKSGFAERIRMTGINDKMLLLTYLAYAMMKCLLSSLAVAILLKVPFDRTASMANSNLIIIWIVLVLFCLQACAFFLAVSSFFTNPTLASIFVIFPYYAPLPIFLFAIGAKFIPAVGQAFCSFFPVFFVHWSIENIYSFEYAKIGGTFGSLVEYPISGNCKVPLLALIFCSILATILYCLVTVYMLNVKPGPYGYAKPWYYIFPKKWRRKKNEGYEPIEIEDSTQKGLYEAGIKNAETGLSINKLHKYFGPVKSVNGVTLDIYVGQITALLGHNGAGKTTTLSMITGMMKPTAGTIEYFGNDIFSDLKTYRKKIGLCPQDDMLLEGLTVWDHMLIFGMLMNIPYKPLSSKSELVLSQVGILEKKMVKVKNLSGGMKRKLCLALALLNEPAVLVLDEPSSGLDPEARREMWDTLLALRGNRVMIITTHFMEEADALGDRIAIMAHGEVKCYGTQMFLKNHYGAGYQVSISCSESMMDAITSYVVSKVPKTKVLHREAELIVLSVPSQNTEVFPSLFEGLETNTDFAITGITVNVTTMDDVFLKVLEEADGGDTNDSLKITRTSESVIVDTSIFTNDETETKKKIGFCQRFSALFMKNVMYSHDTLVTTVFMVLILPLIQVAIFTYTAANLASKSTSNSPLTLDLKVYRDTDVFMAGQDGPLMTKFRDLVQEYGHKVVYKGPDIVNDLLETSRNDDKFIYKKFIAADFSSDVPNLLFSWNAIHSAPIVLNLYYTAILKNYSSDYTLEIVNHPFYSFLLICEAYDSSTQNLGWILLSLPFVFLVAWISIRAAHSERISLLKHLQIMTGLAPFLYWLSFFVWDMIQYTVVLLLSLLIIYFVDYGNYMSSDDGAVTGAFALFLILFLCGIGCILLAYCFSFLFNSSSMATIVYIAVYLPVLILVNLFLIMGPTFAGIQYLFMPIIFGPFSGALWQFGQVSKSIRICKQCMNRGSLPKCTTGSSYFRSELHIHIFLIIIDIILYIIIILFIEHGVFSKMDAKSRTKRIGDVDTSGLERDDDVMKEKNKVDALMRGKEERSRWTRYGMGGSLLVVDGLAKKYNRKSTAVYDVSFASDQGECFGLLGVNGAGKSTTFKMLTGLTNPTRGTAVVRGYDITRETRKCLRFVGYCPQSNVLGEGMTGRQMLTLIAKLRLVPANEIKQVVNRWIALLGLEEIKDRKASTYSGGNKRKLNTALAFLNNPEVILLDEPTSGVDPPTRRNLWSVIKDSQNNKQTVVISSHSMEECEAVCGRLTIMANGCMRCIGTVQHLKQLYGIGFVLLIKLKSHTDQEVDLLKKRINNDFSSKSNLHDEHIVLLHYFIADPSYKHSVLFTIMEGVKRDHPIVEEYTVSNSTLEQVFLSFAKKKND